MKVKTDIETIRRALNALQVILSEATISFNSEGMLTGGIDATKTTMVRVMIHSSVFENYQIGSQLDITLYVLDLWKILKKSPPKGAIELNYDEEKRLLEVVVMSEYMSRYKLKTLETKSLQLPKISMKSAWAGKLISKHFSEAINEISSYTNEIQFIGEKDKLILHGMGETVEVDKVFTKPMAILEIDAKADKTSAYYSAEHLMQIVDAGLKVSDIMLLSFGENSPMYMNSTIPAKLKVEYWVAPRKHV